MSTNTPQITSLNTPVIENLSFTASLAEGNLVSTRLRSNSSAILELQRVSCLFQSSSFISEAQFVINCKNVMNILQYSRSDVVEPQQQALLVEVIENAVITFVIRILPLVFQELISPTSLLHPLSPPMIVSLLEIADAHVNQCGDFTLQLRMAAAHLLIEDNENVVLAFSMCQMLPKIRPNSKWQPVINPVKANPIANIGGSISLPEIHPPVFLESPTSECSSLFGSPIPSLSSLLNCTASSSEESALNLYDQYDPNHVNIMTESVSLPTISLTVGSALSKSRSAPNLRSITFSNKSVLTNPIIPPVIASEEASEEVLIDITASPDGYLFSPSLFSPARVPLDTPAAEIDLSMPNNICVELTSVGNNTNGHSSYPDISTFTSEDDFSRLISGPDVGEEPPPPCLISPNPDAALDDVDFSLQIGPPLSEIDLPAEPEPSNGPQPLSPLPPQISSPLSSPPEIVVSDDPDVFRNIFEADHTKQKQPASPYIKRLRSASNNPQPIVRRIGLRAVSASSRAQEPMHPELASMTLPPPANPRKVVEVAAPTKIRQRRPRTVSASRRHNVSVRSNKALMEPDLAALAAKVMPMPANPANVPEVIVSSGKPRKGTKWNQIIIGDEGSGGPTTSRHRSQRSMSVSVNKENI
ncbi:hypothetical protein H0H87_006334 [Tephrocybe sp. NHM501043]|nr:hypothetical protein H0H87_006334 [Tephrocybe sp. NHM501043]